MFYNKRWDIKGKEVNNMMNYGYMMGGGGNGVMFFSWIIYLLVVALLVLGIAALWKYINK